MYTREVAKTIQSILVGMMIPTHIYLFISRESYLFDEGINLKDIPLELQYLSASNKIFSIIYTDNIGPHRKLLPILKRYWDKDCVIITFDDDKIISKDAIFELVMHYIDNDKEVIVGLRTRRMGFCMDVDPGSSDYFNHRMISSSKNFNSNDVNNINNYDNNKNNVNNNNNDDNRIYHDKNISIRTDLDDYNNNTNHLINNQKTAIRLMNYDFCLWPRIQNSKKEILIIPTGTGGVLYRPKYFHKIIFDPTLRKLTLYNDDLTFRLATLINKIFVVNGGSRKLPKCLNYSIYGTNNTEILPPSDKYTELRKFLSDYYNVNISKNINENINENINIEKKYLSDFIYHRNNIENNTINKFNDDTINDKNKLIHHNNNRNILHENLHNNETDLFNKNLFWNTNMWKAGVAYLELKNIINIKDFYNFDNLFRDRINCFKKRKRKNILIKESKNSFFTENKLISNNYLNNVDDHDYILKKKKNCGILPKCLNILHH